MPIAPETKFIRWERRGQVRCVGVTTMLANPRPGAVRHGGASAFSLTRHERLNQVAGRGPVRRALNEVIALIQEMDRSPMQETNVYRLKLITPERLDRLVKNLLGATAAQRYQASADRESQSLVVTAPPAVHKRIASLLKDLDAPVAETQSPMRFYKLRTPRPSMCWRRSAGCKGTNQGWSRSVAKEKCKSRRGKGE